MLLRSEICHSKFVQLHPIRLAARRSLRRLRISIAGICDSIRSVNFESLERRLLLSGYALSEVTTFGLNASGADPQSSLVADASGNLYGTAGAGGVYGDGTVFEVAKGTNTITTLASFDGANGITPQGLAIDASGNLFGTTILGGANGDGTAFEIGRGSNAITTLVSFEGTSPSAITLDSSGDIYGTTSADGLSGVETVFEIVRGSNSVTTVATFNGTNGSDPEGPVMLDSTNDLFGATYDGGASGDGAIFEVANGSDAITTLASFNGDDGSGPNGVTMDAAGNLYGATSFGGASYSGTVFEIAKGSNAITTLVSFNGTNSYGFYPQGVAVDSFGDLYGTNAEGGSGAAGTVFEIGKGSSATTLLASFSGVNGDLPRGGVILDASANLYGVTYSGGAAHTGNVFEVANETGSVTSLASFDGTNGQESEGSLVTDASGNLYGTTMEGGAYGDGTVFEISAGTTTLTTLASFDYTDGWAPHAGPTLDASGDIFGTTLDGGTDDVGTVYEIAAGSNTITTITSFNGTDGSAPYGGVTLDASGNLFGTTNEGGAYGWGTVFEIAKGSTAITTLVSFNGINGANPETGVALDASDNIYGTVTQGQASLFEIAHGSDTVTALAEFGQDQIPAAAPTFDASGNLYDTSPQGGANRDGTVFEIPAGSTTPTTVATFSQTTGEYPYGGITLDSSGDIFDTTVDGGTYNGGTVFEISAGSSTITTLASLPRQSAPGSGVAFKQSGDIFGTTDSGAYLGQTDGLGTVFELMPIPTVTLYASGGPNPSNVKEPLTFTAAVSGKVPNGETIKLEDASNNDAVVATGPLSNGSATLTISAGTLAVGIHNLIAVYGGDANFAASESALYVQAVLPDVTGISPSNGPAVGGTTVTIAGSGFTGATAVDFGGTPATSFTVNAAGTQITAVDPAGSGTVDVTVVTPNGTSATSAADQFSYGASSLPSWLAAGSAATYNSSTNTLTVTGSATIISDPGSADPNIVASGTAAKLTIAPTTNDVDIHIGGITLTDGASIVMSDVDASQVADGTNASHHHSDHNVLVIGTLGATSDPAISIDSASKLDLGDNDLIVHTGSSDTGTDDVQGFPETNELKAIEALAAEGRNVAPGGVYNGTWTGNGLTSSAAATADSGAYAGYEQNILAVEQNSDMYLGGYSKWTVGSASEMLGANDIIVKYTYSGDLNLDGAVDGNAATIFSTFYDGGATSGNTYAYGDLNGDGKLDGNDATIFSTVYGNGLAGSGLPQL